MLTSVTIEFEGRDGYVVLLEIEGGRPVELARFGPVAGTPGDSNVPELRRVAQAYRDGVAEGIYRHRCAMLSMICSRDGDKPLGGIC